jgi:hypothetical protein
MSHNDKKKVGECNLLIQMFGKIKILKPHGIYPYFCVIFLSFYFLHGRMSEKGYYLLQSLQITRLYICIVY